MQQLLWFKFLATLSKMFVNPEIGVYLRTINKHRGVLIRYQHATETIYMKAKSITQRCIYTFRKAKQKKLHAIYKKYSHHRHFSLKINCRLVHMDLTVLFLCHLTIIGMQVICSEQIFILFGKSVSLTRQ